MSVSYSIRENHNLQTVLWDGCAALARLPVALWSVSVVIVAWSVWLAQLFAADALALGKGLATVALWCAGLTAIVGALMLILSNPVIPAAAVGIGVYAVVFKPR